MQQWTHSKISSVNFSDAKSKRDDNEPCNSGHRSTITLQQLIKQQQQLSTEPMYGRLRRRAAAWAEISSVTPHIQRVVQRGATWRFSKQPPTGWKSVIPPEPTCVEERQAYYDTIHLLEQQQVIKRVPAATNNDGTVQWKDHPRFTSKFFVLRQKDKWRPILGLARLSEYVQARHFKMSTIHDVAMATPPTGAYATKLDLKSAFFSVEVNERLRRYLTFVTPKGHVFEMQMLPMGLACSPLILTEIMAPVWAHLRETAPSGALFTTHYIDDGIFLAATDAATSEWTRRAINTLTNLGLELSMRKCVLVPTRTIEFLGVRLHLDQNELRMSVPPTKWRATRHEIARLLREINHQREIKLQRYVSVLGKLRAMRAPVPTALVNTIHLSVWCRQAVRDSASGRRAAMQQLQAAPSGDTRETIVEELQAWMHRRPEQLTTPFDRLHDRTASVVLYTDASLSIGYGFKAHLQWQNIVNWSETPVSTRRRLPNTITGNGVWTRDEQRQHINVLETRALINALQRTDQTVHDLVQRYNLMTHRTQSKTVIYTDNATTVAVLSHLRPRSIALAKEATRLLKTLENNYVLSSHITVRHVAGTQNVDADYQSRKAAMIQALLDWGPTNTAYDRMCRIHNIKPQHDMFASATSTRCPSYWTMTEGTDAFAQNWAEIKQPAYACPGAQAKLLQRFMTKMQAALPHIRAPILVCVPRWPTAAWWTTYRRIASSQQVSASYTWQAAGNLIWRAEQWATPPRWQTSSTICSFVVWPP